MTNSALDDLVAAHRILVGENVLDAFGHISRRDGQNPAQFWLASAKPPNLVETDDFMRFDLQGAPVHSTDKALFAERYIHSAIYAQRPDVQAICHHHAPALMPFCLVDHPLVAVSQTGGFLGESVPVWDSADAFGPTRMLVENQEQAQSLAQTLSTHSLVLMRGHGATVVSTGIHELVFKAVYACREADMQRRAIGMGPLRPLSAGEIARIGEPAKPAVDRCWNYWRAVHSLGPHSEDKR